MALVLLPLRSSVTRRVFTAGTNKDRLDAFEPLNQTDVAGAKQLLDDAHQHFIHDVEGVKGRLVE